jgi:hypothetical protein
MDEPPHVSMTDKQGEEMKHDPPPDTEFLLDEDVESELEPGIQFKNVIDKEKELDFIRKHPDIPAKHKTELIAFLEKYPELYSGVEFSKKHFPREAYEHDVELIQPLNELRARPFPVSGIRLEQLKENIKELCDNNVLKP